MKLKEFIEYYQWGYGDVFIYSFNWYSTDDKADQIKQDKLYTVFSTKGKELPYHKFGEDIAEFGDNKVYCWWCDEKGLGIMLDEYLDQIKKEKK